MNKQSRIALISIFMFIVIGLFFLTNRASDNDYKVFSNPHQIGEEAMYGKENILFKIDMPVADIKQAKISKRLSDRVNLSRFSNGFTDQIRSRKIFVVNHENEKKTTLQHIQIQEFYDGGGFMIFSAYELDDSYFNPDKIDVYDNKVNIHEYDDKKIVEVVSTDNYTLTQHYYIYNKTTESFNLAATGGNELYAYEDGILYHCMYSDYNAINKALELFEEFIKN